MITVPSTDLHGILSDALLFASPDKEDLERRCVQLRWDGDQLHACATDAVRVAVSSWSRDDPPDSDVQGTLGVELGGADGPWHILLAYDDVKHLLGAAKPVKGLEYVPLFLDVTGRVLSVKRAKESRVPGFALSYDGLPTPFPDLRFVVVQALGRAEPAKEIWLNMVLAADFGKVRQRGGAAKWTFAGPDRPAVVEIGERFVGAIQPVRSGNGAG